MSILVQRPNYPPELREFLAVSAGVAVVSLIVGLAVILSAFFPALRPLTLGYEVSPIAGIFFAVCGLALLLVARIEEADWAHPYGTPAHAHG